MQRLSSSAKQSAAQQQPPTSFEKTIHFGQAQAIVWQIRFIINQITSKKMMTTAANELENLSHQFGKDFDKYLLRELIDQIDLKDPVKAQKDKNEQFKSQLLNQELARCSQNPEFLLYFYEIAQQNFSERMAEFLNELTKRLKLNTLYQLLVALSIFESCNEGSYTEALKILKQKLTDYHIMGRPDPLPEYAVHRLMFHLTSNPDFNQDESLREVVQLVRDSAVLKPGSHIALRQAVQSDLIYGNTNQDEPSISLLREGNGLDNLDKAYKILEPWQLLLDVGHYCTYDYNSLLRLLEEFKDINERTMAKTLLYLSLNHSGTDDQQSRIINSTFNACKKGDGSEIGKGQNNKKTSVTWSIDNLGRAFRELFSTLNWAKVFDSLSEIEDDINLDAKAFAVFLQIFNKSKPQNLGYPLPTILNLEWMNPALQINFIENSIQTCIEKKDKLIPFHKTERRQELTDEISGIKDKVPAEALQVWLSVDLVERLILLSDSHNFTKVRALFDFPIKHLPEYLLLVISSCRPQKGNLMVDELLSLLLPQFLGNHINSIPVLQNLWKNNQPLMIRGICELCRHDQRIMNLSRVLDITQEVKESLIPIVNCEDYYFAVNLGILAGKRDFLHYDVWLKSRIDAVGTPFIKALIKYLKEHIIQPIQDYIKRNTQPAGQVDITPENLETFKAQVLERSHLSKEKLVITIEHLSNLSNQRNQRIKEETHDQIKDMMTRVNEFYPSPTAQTQNSEEIDNAANDYFQKVFSADATQVDQKIVELIDTMQKFKESDVKKEQEIYACMLHSLFDEYRFLHRYPSQYLEKIAKLFGAIIKYRIIDGTLQDIALKFAFEAFRREGKRQKFGVITIRQFFDMLPQFSQFFEDIYEIRNNVQQTDPQMVKDIEELYEKTMKNKKPEEGKEERKRAEEQKGKADISSIQMPKIDQSDFLANFQQNAGLRQTTSAQNKQPPGKIQEPAADTSLQRTSTPLQSQAFIPSYKAKAQESTTSKTQAEQSQLNVQAAAFKRPNQPQAQPQPTAQMNPVIQQQQQIQQMQQINMMGNPNFRPMNIRSPAPEQPVNQQILQMQTQLNNKLQKALTEGAKVRLEDIIEDSNMPGPNSDQQEQIRIIINMTGKSNFAQKLEELKALINQNALPNLNWFIHLILTKRIGEQKQYNTYIEMIKQLNPKESIGLTLAQIVELFKKCMLVDEEMFLKVAQRAQNQASPIKQYIANLGIFLGTITVAGNRPILARELDIKKLLVDGFFSDKLKYVVTFVCKVFKECSKSNIFKPTNPWIKAILEILREIYDWVYQSNQESVLGEIIMEIDIMCKSMMISSITEIKDSGFLKASISKQFQNPSQQIEVGHLMNKSQLVPPPPQNAFQQQQQQQQMQMRQGIPRNQSVSPSPSYFVQPGGIFPNRNMTPSNDLTLLLQQQQAKQDIFERVVVSQEFLQHFTWLGPESEQKLRSVVGKAVDSSIVEILPPVVDRSVTIALITTRELVLKDFAYDGDAQKILKAANLIVQNLAGSLALVTCREPLKMSLTTNLKKAIQQLIQDYNTDSEETYNENVIQEISSIASRENLELGCKLIKKSVIEKALTKVREDPQIRQAIERRKMSPGEGIPFFPDESMAQCFAELPPQLKPNPNGLTDSQFQVYEDFARLSVSQKQRPETAQEGNRQQISGQESNISDIDSILKQIELRQGVDEVTRFQISQKLQQLSTDPDVEEQAKLWHYSQKWFHGLCEKFIISYDTESVNGIVEALAFIIHKYKNEDFQKKMTKYFLEINDIFPNDINLTTLLMKSALISVSEWDLHISQYLREYLQFQQQDNFVQFVTGFIEQSIIKAQYFTYTQFPNLISVIEKISEQPALAKQFTAVLEDLKQKFTWNKETLKNYFHEWVEMSFEENNPKQEQEVNKFFYNLQQMGLYKDSEIMYQFCKVMVEVSIERALFNLKGEKRPADRLDYRYIESFLKLMVVLLKTSDINKHEFMSKLFEAIQEVLDEDHKYKRADFNQKPYYRLLINILTAVNNSQFFNPKTHLLILFSLADLFSKLNPNKYPAFSFAWLELISHKQFMPHFLAFSQSSQSLQQYNAFVGGLYQQTGSVQQKKGGQGGQTQSNPQDNTFYQKWFKFKELIQNLFTFLKNNMVPGQKMNEPLVKYYEATLRVVLVIRHDYPEFLCDFYFNFVNSLPEQCIQLRNIILSANPRNIPYHNPFSKNLKVDTIQEIYKKPRMLSMNFDSQMQNMQEGQDGTFQDHHVYLTLMNLREDLEQYFRTKNPQLIQVICEKMMQSEEVINGRRKINSNIINAVALFIGNYTLQQKAPKFQQKECYEMLKKIILNLNTETRWCFLNCLVNELRYINSYTYFYSWIVLYLFSDIDEAIQEQITRILIERLQVHEPYPWGLCITFRELLQNPKYQFVRKPFVLQHLPFYEQLFQTKLQPFLQTWQSQKNTIPQNMLAQYQQQNPSADQQQQ